MIFNSHSNLAGQHAFLSPSKHHWVGYEDEKFDRMYIAALAARRGTELHEFAHNAVRLGIRLPRNSKTLHAYVNDAIGYRMRTEQILYYSENAFGTADAISFRKNFLRIHDLKTGVIPVSHRQLEIYAALFCLEYGVKPFDIEMEFRIYQNDDVDVMEGDPDVIVHVMDRIIHFDRRIKDIRTETES